MIGTGRGMETRCKPRRTSTQGCENKQKEGDVSLLFQYEILTYKLHIYVYTK